MSRTEERYNILETEARWQAVWRRDPPPPPPAGAAKVCLRVAADPTGLSLDQARGCVVADMLARVWQGRGVAVRLALPPGVERLGLVSTLPMADEGGACSPVRSVVLECDGLPIRPPPLRLGRILGSLPDDLAATIATYGADSLRLTLMSDTAPGRDLMWCDGAIEGAWRFCHRLWRLGLTTLPFLAAAPAPLAARVQALNQCIDETILAVTTDLDALMPHKAIARLRLLTGALASQRPDESGAPAVLRRGLETLLRQLAPILPHLCEELWRRLGHDQPLSRAPWPSPQRSATMAADTVTVAVHVNGKPRGLLHLPRDTDREALQRAALALPAVTHPTRGVTPRQVIVVPNRILNVVL